MIEPIDGRAEKHGLRTSPNPSCKRNCLIVVVMKCHLDYVNRSRVQGDQEAVRASSGNDLRYWNAFSPTHSDVVHGNVVLCSRTQGWELTDPRCLQLLD